MFYAEEAAELGLVKEVLAPDELLSRAIEYAEGIAANCAPSSLAVIKQQLYADAQHSSVSSRRRNRRRLRKTR